MTQEQFRKYGNELMTLLARMTAGLEHKPELRTMRDPHTGHFILNFTITITDKDTLQDNQCEALGIIKTAESR